MNEASSEEINALVTLFNQRRFADMEQAARQLSLRFPRQGIVWKALGVSLMQQARHADALLPMREASALMPGDAETHNSLGVLFGMQERLAEAEASFRRALASRPGFAEAHNNLGIILGKQGQFVEAEASYRRALEIKPDYVEALNNLGISLREQGRLSGAEAEGIYRRVLAIKPDIAETYNNLGNALQDQGLLTEAEASYRRALEIKPDYAEAHSSLLFVMNYNAGHPPLYCLVEALQYGRMVKKKVMAQFASWLCAARPERLRVGFVSGDLRNHPVGYFLESVLAQFDQSRIELIAYPTQLKADALTARIKPYFAEWKPIVGLDDDAAARLIHADGVHILVDLCGHTTHNRLPVFARKPAPVQVAWLGYFATTGVAEMDYLLADATGLHGIPHEHFTETIWYLPDTRLCFTAPATAVPVAPLPALARGKLTFGCFQNLSKVNDRVLAAWGKIFAALPGATLRMQCKQLDDPALAKKLTQRLQHCGIAPARVALYGEMPRQAYLEAHGGVDVMLDTFPYPGGTTTCEALCMGVPTLTLAGNNLLARQGASLLGAAGLADWVAASEEEYIAKAIALTGDLPRLAAMRANLRPQVLASPLFDAPRFARNFEAALWGMWNNFQAQHESSPEGKRQNQSNLKIEIVSATRLTESEFWDKSALGISLRRLASDSRLVAHIAFENRRGLPDVFNARINAQDSPECLVFIHDDVWIDDDFFADQVIDGLKVFDVIGVAGNRRRTYKQPSWMFVDEKFISDANTNLSGRIAHGSNPFGEISEFGIFPAECELLDGVFLAAKKSSLKPGAIQFDPRFDFHFYDMDFCRSARANGLRLGTWLIGLTHQSGGGFESLQWREKYRLYLDKWED